MHATLTHISAPFARPLVLALVLASLFCLTASQGQPPQLTVLATIPCGSAPPAGSAAANASTIRIGVPHPELTPLCEQYISAWLCVSYPTWTAGAKTWPESCHADFGGVRG